MLTRYCPVFSGLTIFESDVCGEPRHLGLRRKDWLALPDTEVCKSTDVHRCPHNFSEIFCFLLNLSLGTKGPIWVTRVFFHDIIIWIAINSRCFFFSHCYILLLSISFHIFRSGECHRIGSLAGAARASSSSACSHPGGGSKIWLTAWDKPWQAQLPNCPTAQLLVDSRWFSLIFAD